MNKKREENLLKLTAYLNGRQIERNPLRNGKDRDQDRPPQRNN
jgi:hypothetical protein